MMDSLAHQIPHEEFISGFNLFSAGTRMIFVGCASRRSYAEDWLDERNGGTTGAYVSTYKVGLTISDSSLLSTANDLLYCKLRDLFGGDRKNTEYTNYDDWHAANPYQTPFHRHISETRDSLLETVGCTVVIKAPLILEHVHLVFNALQNWIRPSAKMANAFYFASVEEVRGPGMELDGEDYTNDAAQPVDQIGNLERLPSDELLPAAIATARELVTFRQTKPTILRAQIADISWRTLSGEWPDRAGVFLSLKEMDNKKCDQISKMGIEKIIHQRFKDVLVEVLGIPMAQACSLSCEQLLTDFNKAKELSKDSFAAYVLRRNQRIADQYAIDTLANNYRRMRRSLTQAVEDMGMGQVLEEYMASVGDKNWLSHVRGARKFEEFSADLAAIEQETRKNRTRQDEACIRGGAIVHAMYLDDNESRALGKMPKEDQYTHLDEALWGLRENWKEFRTWVSLSESGDVDCSLADYLQGNINSGDKSNAPSPSVGPQVMRSYSGLGWVGADYTTRNAHFPLPRLPLPDKLVPFCTEPSSPVARVLFELSIP